MISVTRVADKGLVASLHLPPEPGRHPVVIVLSGSGGGMASAIVWAEPLAELGYVVLSLAYFAMEGVPADLVEIPLEYFKQAIDWVRAHPAVDADRVALLGHSRGGEAALLVAATYRDVRAVVANVPSHVVWQGIHPDPTVKKSAWSRLGTAMPFMSIVPPKDGTSWSDSFAASLRDVDALRAAAIPVDRINGSILFITGTEDRVWPCSFMADAAMQRLRDHRFRFSFEHARYEGGGHAVLVPPYRVGPAPNPWPHESYRRPAWLTALPQMGGTPEGNRLARIDAWPRMIAFLRKRL
jgi:dienelactone hydrolase